MLEYGFNELDNDFVTLWSKLIVCGEGAMIFSDLTKLAELGQINAIQSWYLIAKKGDDNEIIDSNVENTNNEGANVELAKASYDFFKNDRWEQICEWYNEYKNYGFLDRTLDSDEAFTLRSCDYILKSNKAMNLYYYSYNRTSNPLFLERYCEMFFGRTKAEKKLETHKHRVPLKHFRELRKTLTLMFKQDENNPQIAFALGKNLTLLPSNKKLKNLGNQILTKLSERKLSNTLQNYESKAKINEKSSQQDEYEIDVENIVNKCNIDISRESR